MLYSNLIYIIAEYDYRLSCELHCMGFPIRKNSKYELLEFAAIHDYVDVVRHCSDALTLGEKENLLERAVFSNSLYTVKLLYKFVKDEELLLEYVTYALQRKYLDIVYFFISKAYVLLLNTTHNKELLECIYFCGIF